MTADGSTPNPGEIYHCWYYDSRIWERTTFLGVPCQKSVSDMWNYQEIISDVKPSLIVEFGTNCGGSALYFAHVLAALGPPAKVLTVDTNPAAIKPRVKEHPRIECLRSNTSDAVVAHEIRRLRVALPGSLFAIVDSDHRKDHVLAELILLRSVLLPGDYLVLEDTNINGYPVLPGWGDGPMEALVEYERNFPDDYTHDSTREEKFGFTFAPRGFLVRNAPRP